MLILWLFGGVVALCGALTLAEVSASLPESGGEYVIFREAYGPIPAFLAGWVSFQFGFSAPDRRGGVRPRRITSSPHSGSNPDSRTWPGRPSGAWRSSSLPPSTSRGGGVRRGSREDSRSWSSSSCPSSRSPA